jgi:hypothetical protein
MPLVRQELDLPLVVGLAQHVRSEPRDSLAGFDTLNNTVQAKGGAYTKRPGSAPLASGPTSAIALAAHRDATPIVHDGSHVWSYGGGAWRDRGAAATLDVVRTPVVSAGSGIGAIITGGNAVPLSHVSSGLYETACANGVVVVLHATDLSLLATCFAADTKAALHGPTLLATTAAGASLSISHMIVPTLCTVGDTIVALWRVASGAAPTPQGDALWFSMLDTTNLTAGWSAPAVLIGAGVLLLAPVNPADYLRPVAFGVSSTTFVVAVPLLAGTLQVYLYNLGGVPIATAVPFGAIQPSAWAIEASGSTVWVAAADPAPGAGAVNLIALDSSTLAVTGTALGAWTEQKPVGWSERCYALSIRTTATDKCVLVVGNAYQDVAPPYNGQAYLGWRRFQITAGAVATDGAASTVYNVFPVARPWFVGSSLYVVSVPADITQTFANSDLNSQRRLFALDITAARADKDVRHVANIAPGSAMANASDYLSIYGGIPVHEIANLGGGAWGLAMPFATSGRQDALELVEFTAPTATSFAAVGGELIASGGLAWAYDGVRAVDVGFAERPRVQVAAAAGVINATYAYTAIWEYIDATGRTTRSLPAPPVTITLVGQSAVVQVTTSNVTWKEARDATGRIASVNVLLYRTTNGGSTYYLCQSATNYDPAAATWFRGYVEFTDTRTDSSIVAEGPLYTQPGTLGTSLPHDCPGVARRVVQHGDVVAALSDSKQRVLFSAPGVPGDGLWFSPAFVADVEDTSPLVALASLDGRLFAFSRTGIHVIDGSGFAENGVGGYSLPQRLATDGGCIEPRSVVATPSGILFQSPAGLSMLSRSGQVTLFGAAVQDTLDAYPTVQAATVDPKTSRVLFQCVDAGGSGITLVYDYLAGVWTTSARGDNAAAKGAAVIGGVYHYVTSAGQVHAEDVSSYVDNAAWIGQTWETGWIKLTGLQGYQRIWRLLIRFRRRSAFALRVSFAYDYSDTYSTPIDFTDPEIYLAAAAGPGALEIAPAVQRCQAIRVKIEELAGNGQGMELLGLRIVWAKEARTTFAKGNKR